MAQSVNNLPAVQEAQFRSLSWEDPLEKEMATHSGILVWKIPRTEETGGLQSMRWSSSSSFISKKKKDLFFLLLPSLTFITNHLKLSPFLAPLVINF